MENPQDQQIVAGLGDLGDRHSRSRGIEVGDDVGTNGPQLLRLTKPRNGAEGANAHHVSKTQNQRKNGLTNTRAISDERNRIVSPQRMKQREIPEPHYFPPANSGFIVPFAAD